MRVRFTTPARNDLDRIHDYIAKRNRAAATRVTRTIRLTAQGLADFPLMAPETDFPKIHMKWAVPYPYLIFYTIRGADILVLHIRHAAQQPPSAADF
ncbi:type II toxin-antitoxin system RelE/ParE family toxin [Xanthobacteraceae bacterium Astr-EGSB]|uniref:type II toxin-antitoxin system RelE/ParE family toxin n=1 Tax=Astrobacterium formosum TaxID=3069710 RepID=UPI0027AF93A8|nr:type II toxin-antitoxin system RelE/ParE family toxin [Xanthobacteraceae bacterium Astr-EGSB]